MTTEPMQIVSSVAPRHGVITLSGYDIKVRVDRGHLTFEDGIGAERHSWRLPRVGHGLRRLVVIGNDGFISLAALRWILDQKAAFVQLERDGTVVASTGPAYGLDDPRLRRAQALALQTGAALGIARELINEKLAGQEQVARLRLHNSGVADMIAHFRTELHSAKSIVTMRLIESQAAVAYWSAWRTVPITFPKADLRLGVPAHWLKFDARVSPLTGSPRLAASPLNAILNYTYSLLESEARLAASAMGLDPGLGFLHFDTKARDSLACDLMEPVRPQVDAFVLDWLSGAALKREWFFEKRDGNCRLMAPLVAQLSETAPMWRRAVAPYAEWVARTLWASTRKSDREAAPATRLTQRLKREAKGAAPLAPPVPAPVLQNSCRECGAPILPGSRHCYVCSNALSGAKERFIKSLPKARVVTLGAAAQRLRADSQRRHHAELRKWKRTDQPDWITEEIYIQKIQPRLPKVSGGTIAKALGVCLAYACDIQRGKRRPHPRHWEKLAGLVGVSPGEFAPHTLGSV